MTGRTASKGGRPCLPLVDERTRLEDEVVVFSGQAKGTTWHTDPDCGRLQRHAGALVEHWGVVESLVDFNDTQSRSRRRDACASCARPAMLALAVREAARDPQSAVRVVLGCPKLQFSWEGAHRRCTACADLRRLARALDTAAYTAADGHQIIYLPLPRALLGIAGRAYVAYLVPDDAGGMTSEFLAIAWNARSGRSSRTSNGPGEVHALRDNDNFWQPLATLGFEAAGLVLS